jgi:hypothetical protein
MVGETTEEGITWVDVKSPFTGVVVVTSSSVVSTIVELVRPIWFENKEKWA